MVDALEVSWSIKKSQMCSPYGSSDIYGRKTDNVAGVHGLKLDKKNRVVEEREGLDTLRTLSRKNLTMVTELTSRIMNLKKKIDMIKLLLDHRLQLRNSRNLSHNKSNKFKLRRCQ